MSVSAALKSALAVLPEVSRTVKFRGHPCEMWPIEAGPFTAIALQDEQMVTALFGVDMQTGQAAAPEQIEHARKTLSMASAAKIIAASMRDPEIEALVPNMTAAERKRAVDVALELSIGGDPEGFFGDVAATVKAAIKLASSLPSAPKPTSGAATTSSTAIQSANSSKPPGRSKRA